MKYLYVMSHAFSGSTLMAFLLGSHPEIATIGEITVTHGIDVQTYPCSCGELIHQCPFWTRVRERMQQQGLTYDVFNPHLRFRSPEHPLADRLLRAGSRHAGWELLRAAGLSLVPSARRELETLLARNLVFARTVLEVRGRSVFLDISKHPNRLLHLKRIPELDIHVIHLVRDARAVSRSVKKNLGLSLEEGARSWSEFATACLRVRRLFSDSRWFELRYEDLCRDPDATMARLHDFAGVDRSERYRSFRDCEHHIIGNRMRLESSSEIRLDERWKETLSDEDVLHIERVAGTTNRRFGYGAR